MITQELVDARIEERARELAQIFREQEALDAMRQQPRSARGDSASLIARLMRSFRRRSLPRDVDLRPSRSSS